MRAEKPWPKRFYPRTCPHCDQDSGRREGDGRRILRGVRRAMECENPGCGGTWVQIEVGR